MSAYRWDCSNPCGFAASLICTHSPGQLGSPRGIGSLAQGGQDTRSCVRPSLTGSEGTGSGGVGISLKTCLAPRTLGTWNGAGHVGNRSPFIKGGGARGGLLCTSTSKTLLQQLFRIPNQVPGARWLPTPLSAPESALPLLPYEI